MISALRSALRRMLAPPGRPTTRPGLEALEERRLLSAPGDDPAGAALSLLSGLSSLVSALVTVQPPGGDPNVVFLGDSITWGFAYGPGAPVWSATMARRGAADAGVIGQGAEGLLWQVATGELAGVHPSVVVLTIGINDLLLGQSPEQTALGTLLDVYAVHLAQPQAEVLVLGVTPAAQSPDDPIRGQIAATNGLVGLLAPLLPQTLFADVGPALEEPDGSISDAVLSDYLHPTALGYARLAAALQGPLDQALAAGQPAPGGP